MEAGLCSGFTDVKKQMLKQKPWIDQLTATEMTPLINTKITSTYNYFGKTVYSNLEVFILISKSSKFLGSAVALLFIFLGACYEIIVKDIERRSPHASFE